MSTMTPRKPEMFDVFAMRRFVAATATIGHRPLFLLGECKRSRHPHIFFQRAVPTHRGNDSSDRRLQTCHDP